jgi:prepilin-type processing-associated H-X9-DG protein
MREPAPSTSRGTNRSETVRTLLPHPRSAFSALELLVIVALIVVLTTMYWSFGTVSSQRRLQRDCQQHLGRIHLALELYARDFGGAFPKSPGAKTAEDPLAALVPKYSVDTSIFICPGGKDAPLPPGEPFGDHSISYAYYMGRNSTAPDDALMSDRQVDTRSRSAGQYAFSATGKPPGNNHGRDGGNILFCDGHADPSPARVPFPLEFPDTVLLLNPRL